MVSWLRSLVPTRESIRSSRWLRWFGPALQHPRLWRASRRGLALGVAVGVFFGLLFPLAQIPLSAAAAIALRANLPVAVASTLVSNPATFGPLYYAAWRIGSAILGEPASAQSPAEMTQSAEPAPAQPHENWLDKAVAGIRTVGKPLLLGLAVLASVAGLLAYVLVSWAWVWRVRRRRRRRLQTGANARPPD